MSLTRGRWLCAARPALFVSLISRFVVWYVEVVHAHLQNCLLHKSLPFFVVDLERKLAVREKVLFKHSQLPNCPTHRQSSYTSKNRGKAN